MMEALSLEVETTKPNRDKCKIPTLTPTPKAVLMADMVVIVDRMEVEAATDGTDSPSRV